jgi:protein required for attachment to host cells
MNDYWVIVADGARARIMALEQRAGVPSRAAVRLVESARLSNPQHTVAGRRTLRKIKSGRDVGRGRMAPHGYTDKREPHEAAVLRSFASRIAQQAIALSGRDSSMVLAADPRMLGLLRNALKPAAGAGVTVRELAHDYTWCTAPQLRKHLRENGLLPEVAPAT